MADFNLLVEPETMTITTWDNAQCSDQLPHARAQGPSDNGAPKQDGDDDRLVSIILMLVDGVTYHYYLAT